MDKKFDLKYRRILEIINDAAGCADGKLILVGGTALALFYLKHRISVDLDFVPITGDDIKLKESLKGCLTKKGYRTIPARYKNQFVVQFEDTSIKVEVFIPKNKIKKTESFKISGVKLAVASIDDILEQKLEAYANRKHVRDLYDIIFILKNKANNFDLVGDLLTKYGKPEKEEEIEYYIENEENYEFFKEVVKNASKASHNI